MHRGQGARKKLTSGTIGDILADYLEPDFASQDYDAGVRKVFDALYEKVAGIYGMKTETTLSSSDGSWIRPETTNDGSYDYVQNTAERRSGRMLTILIIVIILFILFGRGNNRPRGGGGGGGGRGFFTGMFLGSMMGRNSGRGWRNSPPRGGFGGHDRGGSGGTADSRSGRGSGGFGGGRSSGGGLAADAPAEVTAAAVARHAAAEPEDGTDSQYSDDKAVGTENIPSDRFCLPYASELA